MNFCSNCGTRVVLKVPEGDLLPRHVCDNCGTIHYQNPKLVVGCVPEYEGRILICKRGIEPRRGYWTIPAGFMENDETLEAGAAREAQEEALIDVEIGSLLLLANVTHARQVHVFFRSRMRTPGFRRHAREPGSEAGDEKDIPWERPRLPEHRIRAAPLRRGPRRGRRTAPRGRDAAPVQAA